MGMAREQDPLLDGVPSLEGILDERSWIRSLSLALVGPSDADDLTQDAWLALIERQRQGEGAPISDAALWLRGTLWRLGAKRRRLEQARQGREREYASEMRSHVSLQAERSVDQLAEEAEMQREVVARLLALEEPVLGTMLLRFQAGLTAAEIARRCDLPPGTVRRRIKTGLDRLREQMDSVHGDRSSWLAALVAAPHSSLKLYAPSAAIPAAVAPWMISMKKFLAVIALLLALGTMIAQWPGVEAPGAQSGTEGEPRASSPPPSPSGDREIVADLTTKPKERMAIPQAKSAGPDVPTYRFVDSSGKRIAPSRVVAIMDGKATELTLGEESAASFPDANAARTGIESRESATVPLVVARSGSWPHTFEAPLGPGAHRLVWPGGISLDGRLSVDGVEPGAPIKLTLHRDMGWSARPHAKLVDTWESPLHRHLTALADGTFKLYDLPPNWRGELSLERGWAFVGLRTNRTKIDVTSGVPPRFEIEPTCRVVGRLVSKRTGEPLAHQYFQPEETVDESQGTHEATTDRDGRFEWRVSPRATSLMLTLGVGVDFVQTDTDEISLPLNGTVDLGDIELEPAPTLHLRIVDEADRPAVDAQVREQRTGPIRHVTTDGSGLAEMRVSGTDSVTVEVTAAGFAHTSFHVALPEDHRAVDLILRPDFIMSLIVVDARGKPVPSAEIAAVPTEMPAGALAFTRIQRPPLTHGTVSSLGSSKGVPHFKIRADEEGRIEAHGLDRRTKLLVGIQITRGEWLGPPLVVQAGPDGLWSGTITDQRAEVARVSGFIVAESGEPIERAYIYVLGSGQVLSAADGHFTAPGSWNDGFGWATVKRSGFATRRIKLVEVNAGDIRVVLTKERPLTVRLMDSAGRSAGGMQIGISQRSSTDGWNYLDSVSVLADGVAVIKGLAAGEVRLRLEKNGVHYQRKVLAAVSEEHWQLEEPGEVEVDWSPFLDAEQRPSFLLLRRPAPTGQEPKRISDQDIAERVSSAEVDKADGQSVISCAPGTYDLAIFRDRQEVLTQRVHVAPGASVRIEAAPATNR